MKILQIDDTAKVISSSTWRGICLGFKEDGEPGGSQSTWAKFRAEVGLINKRERATLQRSITRRTAFLLLVRSKLAGICEQIEVEKPRVKDIDIFMLETIGDAWLQKMGQSTAESAIRALAVTSQNIPGDRIAEVIEAWLGKPISLRTIRRKCKGRLRISLKKNYSGLEMQQIFKKVC